MLSGARRFLAGRFARGEYLGLHLTAGLAVSVGAMVGFAALTEDVVAGDALTRFDVQLLGRIEAHATPVGIAVFHAITLLGSAVTMTVLTLVVAIVLARARLWFMLGGWLAAQLGGRALDWALKVIVHRPRPPHAARFLAAASWSFPSGHAMGSLIGYGMLAYLAITLWVSGRAARLTVAAAATLLALAIGASRLYLGVHYFSDVVAGYAAGLVWLSACVSGLELARRMPRR